MTLIRFHTKYHELTLAPLCWVWGAGCARGWWKCLNGWRSQNKQCHQQTYIPMPLTKWQGPGWWSQMTWPMLRNLLQSTGFTTVTQQTDWHTNLKRHDEVITWKHFPRYWPFVLGILRLPVNSPHKGQWRGAFMRVEQTMETPVNWDTIALIVTSL